VSKQGPCKGLSKWSGSNGLCGSHFGTRGGDYLPGGKKKARKKRAEAHKQKAGTGDLSERAGLVGTCPGVVADRGKTESTEGVDAALGGRGIIGAGEKKREQLGDCWV